MTPVEILTSVVCVMAFVGYVACLSHLLWLTIAATAGLGFYLSRYVPFTPESLIYWGGAAGLLLAALLCLWFLPAKTPPAGKPRRQTKEPQVVIDGTNVMYWDGEADLGTLRAVVDLIKAKGLTPFVFLDASSRHHLGDTSLDEKGFSKALGLRRDSVMVCPARTEADAFILKFAREKSLPVVSNDRFGDRAQQAKGLKLIKGGIAGGKPILHGI
ncbi:hypothetical protein OS190_00975 [Sulfitobacter sp. F26204]|uniref:NYN domain-containing protein n=1 Tax=Sulfitobacter sp. F26204 TaxID=2996014 RepID=UPI00225E16E7|nr:hypothetical protein [Sulfitobacter sp. F26204]MCX7558120.1 hypothetical protein [Sulfitobacter sp. F26204]